MTRSDEYPDPGGSREPGADPAAHSRPDTDPDTELDAEAVKHAASAALNRMRDLQDALAAVRGGARSESGDVRVVAEGSGAIVELHLESAALSRSADELGRVIVETAEAAARAAYSRHAEVLREYSSDAK